MRHFYAWGSSQFQNLRPECGCIHFSFEVQNRSRSWEKWETSSLRRDNLLATPPWCLVCGGNNLCGVETLNNWRRELTHTRVVKSKNLPGLSNQLESGLLCYIAIITSECGSITIINTGQCRPSMMSPGAHTGACHKLYVTEGIPPLGCPETRQWEQCHPNWFPYHHH